jgi:hypothetical protein
VSKQAHCAAGSIALKPCLKLDPECSEESNQKRDMSCWICVTRESYAKRMRMKAVCPEATMVICSQLLTAVLLSPQFPNHSELTHRESFLSFHIDVGPRNYYSPLYTYSYTVLIGLNVRSLICVLELRVTPATPRK